MPDNEKITPEQAQEANIKAVQEILSNPGNAEKFPDIFQAAKEKGLVDENNVFIKDNPGQGDNNKPNVVLEAIRNRYGNAYQSEEEFFSEVDKYKATSGFNMDIFRTLDEPLFHAIEKSIKGEDWREAVKGDALIDFSKNYTEDQLLDIFYPNKFKTEEKSDPENVAVKAAKQAAKEAFVIKQQEVANKKALADTRRQQSERIAKETLEKTIASFKKVYPKATLAQIARLQSELTTGKYQNMFLDGRGGFSEDAASNLFPLIFTQEWRSEFASNSAQAAEEVAQNILDRGGKPAEHGRKGTQIVANDKMKQLQDLAKSFTKTDNNPFVLKPASQS